ncbi:MAG TPA: serine/threonine protein kinase [Firmicutes bacterium]|nr:serine/threonine protein kinase [Bacillota bacterium]
MKAGKKKRRVPKNLCLSCMSEKGKADVCPVCGWHKGEQPDSPLFLLPGTVLNDRYLFGRVLGHGGFGITYLAWDLNLHIKLAIKEYLPQNLATRAPGSNVVSVFTGEARKHFEYGLEKFIEEARILAQFNGHPCIVSVHGFFRENETAYLIMDYLEGITLKDYVEGRDGKIPVEAGLEIMMPVMDALREVHNVGLLHRDISPENIYITSSKQVRLLDFGAARMAVGEQSRSLSVILKPGYAPEEQYRNKGNQGPWTDVYGVAATIYRVITGKVPVEALERLERDSLQPPSALGVTISPVLEAALMKALSVRAKDRYQSIKEFQDEIGKYLQSKKSEQSKDGKEGSSNGAPSQAVGAAGSKVAPEETRSSLSDMFLVFRVIMILLGVIGLASWFDNYQRLTNLKYQYSNLVEDHAALKEELALAKEQLRKVTAGNRDSGFYDRYYQLSRDYHQLNKQFKAIQEELAEECRDLSIEVVGFDLKNTGKGERPLGGDSVIFSANEIRYITFYITLQNKTTDVTRIQGRLAIKYFNPDGSLQWNSKSSPPGCTLYAEFDLADRTIVTGGWGDSSKNIFKEGTNLIEVWYEGRKLAEKKFVVF